MSVKLQNEVIKEFVTICAYTPHHFEMKFGLFKKIYEETQIKLYVVIVRRPHTRSLQRVL